MYRKQMEEEGMVNKMKVRELNCDTRAIKA